jgi:membrane complex biogenesis BtpA family protein
MIGGLIGMVHLGPLPGSARSVPLDETIDRAVSDAVDLVDAGFDALMIENFGDAPFFADDVPKITIAAMTRAIAAIAAEIEVPFGVNVLRNDGLGALAVAAATGANFIRINVLSGSMSTDQGTIVGRAAEVSRLKAALTPDVAILADVMVKHAAPPPGLTLDQAAADLWERAGADGIIVSGTNTGQALDRRDLDTVHATVPDAPLYAGSGVTEDTVADILTVCAGVIVGTATKIDGVTANRVDPVRARAIVEAAK